LTFASYFDRLVPVWPSTPCYFTSHLSLCTPTFHFHSWLPSFHFLLPPSSFTFDFYFHFVLLIFAFDLRLRCSAVGGGMRATNGARKVTSRCRFSTFCWNRQKAAAWSNLPSLREQEPTAQIPHDVCCLANTPQLGCYQPAAQLVPACMAHACPSDTAPPPPYLRFYFTLLVPFFEKQWKKSDSANRYCFSLIIHSHGWLFIISRHFVLLLVTYTVDINVLLLTALDVFFILW
jgi:hypothetical protein